MNIDNSRVVTYKGYTLVDITNTGVTKYTPDNYHQRNQQRNWETVLQILGMRTQLFRVEQTGNAVQELNKFEFGSAHQGKQRVWSFEFDVEFVGAVPLTDFDSVPVVGNLDETVKSTMNLFYTQGENKNIYFKSSQ